MYSVLTINTGTKGILYITDYHRTKFGIVCLFVSEAAKFFEPPSYSVATSLPTYEEAEQSKAEEAEASRDQEQDQEVILAIFLIHNIRHKVLHVPALSFC